ncbi:MAG: hypothetical protein JNJ77_03550 [Planctomycetia bacterium]|nr:hypothetical protein [Planctomycetia bacterium]
MALPAEYMTPEMYMGFYRSMYITVAEGSDVHVDIRKYLNHGKVVPLPTPDPVTKKTPPPRKPEGILEERATAANKEYWLILSQVATDPFRDSPGGNAKKITANQVPLDFYFGGRKYNRRQVHLAYMGKGSPVDVAMALRLASRYRIISTEGYCDKFLGLDCTGFVSNYWGLSKTENIDHKDFDKNRRKDLSTIRIGDALVYYKGKQSSEHKKVRSMHIAVLNEVLSESNSGSEVKLTMNYVESAGNDEGVHKSQTREIVFKKTREGELYYDTTSGNTGYLCGGPPMNRPNGF